MKAKTKVELKEADGNFILQASLGSLPLTNVRMYLANKPHVIVNPPKGNFRLLVDALIDWRHHNTRDAVSLVNWAKENNKPFVNLLINQAAASDLRILEDLGHVLWITSGGHIYMGRKE